ncbi:MAG: hypothetical protein R3B82_09250 [Sandaracinaceae bacterium]
MRPFGAEPELQAASTHTTRRVVAVPSEPTQVEVARLRRSMRGAALRQIGLAFALGGTSGLLFAIGVVLPEPAPELPPPAAAAPAPGLVSEPAAPRTASPAPTEARAPAACGEPSASPEPSPEPPRRPRRASRERRRPHRASAPEPGPAPPPAVSGEGWSAMDDPGF